MKRKIVAIGGGKIMVPPGRAPQTLSIDHQIVKLADRKRAKVVDELKTTNREIKRERDREAKRYKRLVEREKKEKYCSLVPVNLLPLNALTDFTRKKNAVGEYRVIRRRKYVVED